MLYRDKDNEVVEYALSRDLSPTLVAENHLQLPDKKLLQAKLHELYAEIGSFPLSASCCLSLGLSKANRISRVDSTEKSALRFDQLSPPPMASITTNPGLSSFANTARTWVVWSDLAFKQILK